MITVVGGGLAGLVAAITAAEAGAPVEVFEARRQLGGRARTTGGEFRANHGAHVVYDDGPLWAWLRERKLAGSEARSPVTGFRFLHEGELHRTPPLAMARLFKLVRRTAPDDVAFHDWVASQLDERSAQVASRAAQLVAFRGDAGSLAASFVWPRLTRPFVTARPKSRYFPGGWSTIVARLEQRARDLGVPIHRSSPVDELPRGPVVVATELSHARRLLDDASLEWPSGRVALFDVGLAARRGDPFIVWDLDGGAWVERFSAADRTLAPEGHDLIQAAAGLREGEPLAAGIERIERVLDLAYPRWREREVWRRRGLADAQTGALDAPGTTWRDRPGVSRGDGVYLAGDCVAAPGLLSEVSVNSAVEAGRLAAAAVRGEPVA